MFTLPSRAKLVASAALVMALSGIVSRSASSEQAKQWRWIGVWGFTDCTFPCEVNTDERCNCFR